MNHSPQAIGNDGWFEVEVGRMVQKATHLYRLVARFT